MLITLSMGNGHMQMKIFLLTNKKNSHSLYLKFKRTCLDDNIIILATCMYSTYYLTILTK